jgi:tight adherence protein B
VLAAVAAGSFLLATAAPAWAVVQTVRIRSVDQEAFPQVTVTVAVGSETAVAPGDIRIAENGRAVRPLSVEPLGQTGRRVDVVLAIDVSDSVTGRPLATGLAAARDFVRRLPPGIHIGVVTFAQESKVVRPLTRDHASVLDVLQDHTTSYGTALYAAVVTASEMFSAEGQRTIVLLTDGTNVSRTGTLESALTAAKGARASVFTVGVQSSSLNEGALRRIADETGGAYSPATEASLGQIYQGLAGELSQQFEITYRSVSGRGRQVSIAVNVEGIEDSALALTPEARPVTAPETTNIPVLTGTWGLLVALSLCFLAVFWLFLVVLGVSARTRRRRDLSRRMGAEQVAQPTEEPAERSEGGLAGWIPQPVVAAAERIAEAGGFAKALDGKLERAGLPLSSGEFLAANAASLLLGLLIGSVALRSPLFTLILAVVGGITPNVLLSIAVGRRTSRLHAQLADVVTILASSLRAGHSFSQALEVVSREVDEPAGPEFQRVVAEVRLGRHVEEALSAMATRVGSEDFKWAVLAVNIQREVGGNLAEVLDIVADTLRERDALRRQVRVLSAEVAIGIIWARKLVKIDV